MPHNLALDVTDLETLLSYMHIKSDSNGENKEINDLTSLFSRMNIVNTMTEKPDVWFWYKGQPIRSKEDFKQLVMREMLTPL